jgi:glutamate dehydrogenase
VSIKPSATNENSSDSNSRGPQRAWAQTLRQEIVEKIDQQMAEVLDSLPPAYFESLPEVEQLSHLKALMAFKICDIKHEIMLRRPDGRKITVISRENYPGYLAGLIRRLPDQGQLIGGKIFTSRDKEFIIDMFEFQPEGAYRTNVTISCGRQATIVAKVVELTGAPDQLVEEFIAHYHPENDILDSPDEIAKQFTAMQKVEHTNDIAILWEAVKEPDGESSDRHFAKVVVSAGSVTTRAIFQRAAEFFAEYKVDIEKAFFENVFLGDATQVALTTFHISIAKTQLAKLVSDFGPTCSPEFNGDVLRRRMSTFMRVDEEVVAPQAIEGKSLTAYFNDPRTAEVFCALTRLTQHVIGFRHSVNISREQVLRKLLRFDAVSRQVLTGFMARFDRDSDTPFSWDSSINLEAITDINDRLILRTFHELATKIERANLYVRGRRTLAFRFAGDMFANDERGETPFAIFYVYGQGFDGFHVRFRDVARGGMRLVLTRNDEHYLFESTRIFDEVYRLSSAQQLKNKDIAEGGAKAAVVLKPNMSAERAGRDFVDGLLDLVINVKQTTARDIEPLEQEYLYLGPDENVTNNLIEWIVERAARRGYPLPSTIMSSKPTGGINHKQYGVTSEGVTVFLHRALLENGFDPTNQKFTVKLTGGPDGDVGGNEIKILIREYGDNVQIVAIADGTGAAHDPDGVNHDELLHLVEEGFGIAHFSRAKLGPNGRVVDLADDEQIAWRNNLHFTVQSDVFVPAGGRPSAINEANWKSYLRDDGTPSSPIIVEGANLFITEEARQHLAACGTVIVKDSSANKCGVICSSLEIVAGMLLSEEEFLSIKPTYVEEVLVLLRKLASTEAISLFNEQSRLPELTLPEISVLMSKQIIRVADVINNSFDRWEPKDQQLASDFILYFLPKSLVDRVGEGLIDKIPHVYRRQLVAAILSSRIAYREGCQNIRSMTDAGLENLVISQLGYEAKVRGMIEQLQQSDLPDRERMISILEHSAARTQRELKL